METHLLPPQPSAATGRSGPPSTVSDLSPQGTAASFPRVPTGSQVSPPSTIQGQSATSVAGAHQAMGFSFGQSPFAPGRQPIGGKVFMEHVVGVKLRDRSEVEGFGMCRRMIWHTVTAVLRVLGSRHPVGHAFNLLCAFAILILIVSGFLTFAPETVCELRVREPGYPCCSCIKIADNAVINLVGQATFAEYDNATAIVDELRHRGSLSGEVRNTLTPTIEAENGKFYGLLIISTAVVCGYLLARAVIKENAYLTAFVVVALFLETLRGWLLLSIDQLSQPSASEESLANRILSAFDARRHTGVFLVREIFLIVALVLLVLGGIAGIFAVRKYGLLGIRRTGVFTGGQQAYRWYQIVRALALQDQAMVAIFYVLVLWTCVEGNRTSKIFVICMNAVNDLVFHTTLSWYVQSEHRHGTKWAFLSSVFTLTGLIAIVDMYFSCYDDAVGLMRGYDGILSDEARLLFPDFQSVAYDYTAARHNCLRRHTTFDARTNVAFWLQLLCACTCRVLLVAAIAFVHANYYGTGHLRDLFFRAEAEGDAPDVVEEAEGLDDGDVEPLLGPMMDAGADSPGATAAEGAAVPKSAAPTDAEPLPPSPHPREMRTR